jgi:outer membrane protein assembly factor BamB
MPWSRRAFFGCAMAMVVTLFVPTAGGATAATPIPTTTTLESSVASSTYDSPVTFTASVTSAAGGVSGWVLLIDESNGAVLAALSLKGSTATFRTAALAPGSRRIVAQYQGDSNSSPSTSSVLDIPVARVSDAVAYQVDPAHDGHQVKGPLKAASLVKKWSVTLAAGTRNVSYPLIAGGRVFVTVPNGATSGSKLFALNAANGAVDWSATLAGTSNAARLAYDGRRVFALTGDGVLTAFVMSTGSQIWSTKLPNQSFPEPPTAYDTNIYVSGFGGTAMLYAVSEAGGDIRWNVPVVNGDSLPAVDITGAYVSYGCGQDYKFSLQGSPLWRNNSGCGGGFGTTVELHRSSVYIRNLGDPPLILAKSTGSRTGTFASSTAPAFDKTNMYTLQNGNLVAVDPSGRPNRWTFRNGTLGTPPVVSGAAVFVGGSAGKLYAVSASSGAKLWTGTASSPNASGAGPMAVGGGLLVVPAGPTLTAFGN